MLRTTPGERCGCVGNGPLKRVLIIGDSAAAGVGAEHQQNALAGQLAEQLSQHYQIEWELHAKTGATTRSTLQYLQQMKSREYDLAVTSLGVNDVTAGVGVQRWLKLQRQLRSLLREKFGIQQLLVSGMPPVSLFPALPQPLRWYLGSRANDFDDALRSELEGEQDSLFLNLYFGMPESTMASDGFHPGPAIYAEWAKRITALLHAEA